MQIENRLKNHYRRWNINFSYEEEFEKFKNRVIVILNNLVSSHLLLNPEVDKHFLKIFNLENADKPSVKKSKLFAKQDPFISDVLAPLRPSYQSTEKGFGDTYVYSCINDCETLQKLATVLQILFWSLEDDTTQELLSEIAREIKNVSVLTPSASFQIFRKGKQVIIYPSGEQFLDKGIIDFVLSGLEDYPIAAKHFEQALKAYQSGDTSQYRNLLDNLRFALEQLLKKIFDNEKPLEKQDGCLRSWFKEKHLHSQVANLYETLLKPYRQYQNDAVKHNEAFSLDEVEFMIYLTGSFMRLLLQLGR